MPQHFEIFCEPVCVTDLNCCREPFNQCPRCRCYWRDMMEIKVAVWTPPGGVPCKYTGSLRVCECGTVRYEESCWNCIDEEARRRAARAKEENEEHREEYEKILRCVKEDR